jgi:hypothetical protein
MRGIKLYMLLSSVFLVFYLLAQYYKPVPTNWKPTYLKEDNIPFGLYILHQQLLKIFPGAAVEIAKRPVYNVLKSKQYHHSAYLFIASTVEMNKMDFQALKHYMEEGNDVLIAAHNLGGVLSDTLKMEINSSYRAGRKKNIPIGFKNPSLGRQSYVFDLGLGVGYFSKLDSSRAKVLGTNKNGDINFVKYAFGKGNLYVLPNPQLLTNYSLLKPAGAEYVAKALSCLNAPEILIWDEVNTVGVIGNRSPLSIIFRYESLTWAYYLLLSGLVVYVLFEIKRRQRIIPVVDPLQNSTVEFVKVVGKVYYEQRDNKDIALKKINYLLEYFRSNYRLKTGDLNQETEELLVVRSGLPVSSVKSLLETIQHIQNSSVVSDESLLRLNRQIEDFYKQAQ